MVRDELLYHYTSIDGLNGIISSRSVWASDCRYLNDQKELVHAIELFLSRFEGDTKETLSFALKLYNFSRAHCVFSLSHSPHVLSQWRAYGDSGCGAAIGFVRNRLLGIGESSTHILVDCIYHDHESFLDGVVEERSEEIEALLKMYSNSRGALDLFVSLINENPKPLMCLFSELLKVKNPAFKEEQEVRLVISVPIRQVQTRVANKLIIPFVEHSFVDNGNEENLWCVAPEIWFGPRCDKRNMQALLVFGQFGWSVDGIHHYDCGYI
ncbi:DUF2971 domain-containing protein [Nitrosomonas oligotropha]|uniref:DUF2971 domain-containing protein n=1 Tax=Nitrosomonas oligotropha TaxID=42354 RepID=UPI00136E54BA|nr:DUF2971 domain-containing protein [Nitrosomonas oligotropha]MXS83803.1 DUF2971 domain-containing protein [Nitrosomonas oligotropha]